MTPGYSEELKHNGEATLETESGNDPGTLLVLVSGGLPIAHVS
jgi:hypothetical protein